MMRRRFLALACLCTAGVLFLGASTAFAGKEKEKDPKKEEKYKKAVTNGLEWLAKNQSKDGHWEAFNGQYPVTMTAMGGMALLMEGSNIREGKYKDNIRRACQWLMDRSSPNGMIGNPNIPGESGRYTYGHGYAMMFLACVYGEEEEGPRRTKLEDILTRAAKFSRDSQTNRGGWGYVSAREGNNFDEGSTTVTQVQGLRAVRNAGVPVPPDAIKDAIKYLKDASNNPSGGIVYSLGGGGGGDGRPALTAAGIACGFSTGDYNSELVKKWFKFCTPMLKQTIGVQRMGHDEYTYYYLSQAVYMLGEDGWNKLFPGTPEADQIKWSSYRERTFDSLISTQQADGSWPGQHAGPVFSTSIYLSIMQLDNAVLPLYQR
jgi:squalene cyclase